MRKLSVAYKKSNFEINAREVSGFNKYIGLMFKSSKTNNLIFNFKKYEKQSIHSFFVFFPFLALWLDEKNKILEWNIVRPFTFHVTSKQRSAKLIELPFNKSNKNFIDYIVGERKDLNRTSSR